MFLEPGSGTPDQKQHQVLPSEDSEMKSFGGSQHSLNSNNASNNTLSSSGPIDDPEHITVQKQRKELVEEGIKRYQMDYITAYTFIPNCCDLLRFVLYYFLFFVFKIQQKSTKRCKISSRARLAGRKSCGCCSICYEWWPLR